MIEKVKKQVYELLNKDNSGHGNDHIDRVLELSLKFAQKETANKDVVALIALLHDVDDYKLFGEENAENLTKPESIMNKETYIAPSIEVVNVETESMIASSTFYINMSNSPTNSDASMANGFRGDWVDF